MSNFILPPSYVSSYNFGNVLKMNLSLLAKDLRSSVKKNNIKVNSCHEKE